MLKSKTKTKRTKNRAKKNGARKNSSTKKGNPNGNPNGSPNGGASKAKLTKAWGLKTTMTNTEMIDQLAAEHVRKYHELPLDAARAYVKKQWPSRFDLALAMKAHGLPLS